MTIQVKQYQNQISKMDEDGNFRCVHNRVDILPPCCNGRDSEGFLTCMCMGLYSVLCMDCNNEDMMEYDADHILEREFGYDQ